MVGYVENPALFLILVETSIISEVCIMVAVGLQKFLASPFFPSFLFPSIPFSYHLFLALTLFHPPSGIEKNLEHLSS